MKSIKFLVISLFLASSGTQAQGLFIHKEESKENHSIISTKNNKNLIDIMNNSLKGSEDKKKFNTRQSLFTLDTKLDQVSINYNIKEYPLLKNPSFINEAPLPTKKDMMNVKNETNHKSLVKFIASSYNVPNKTAEKIVSSAFKVSKNYKIDPVILLSITAVESRFDPKAKNGSGAIGLVQAMPSAHPEKIKDIKKQGKSVYDIESNLALGAQIYSEYLQKSNGNVSLALQRYNGSVKDSKKRYSRKVLKVMKPLQVAYNH